MPESVEPQTPAPEPASKDDFYQRMLRMALRKADPDLDELRALLRLIQQDGGDPQATYEELAAERPSAPDYQRVAPRAQSPEPTTSAEPTPEVEPPARRVNRTPLDESSPLLPES